MYCKNCGALIEESANFCPNCASRVNETAVAVKSEQTLQENGRNEMLKQIDIAKSYAAAIQNNYNNILGLEKEKNVIRLYRNNMSFLNMVLSCCNVYPNENTKLFKIRRNTGVRLDKYLKNLNYDMSFAKKYNIMQIISFVLFILLVFCDYFAGRQIAQMNTPVYLATWFSILIVIFITSIISTIYIKKNFKRLLDDRERSISAQSQELYNNSNAILCEYQQKNGVIPEKYCCLYALDYLRDCIVTKRADNFKEAFNLFEAYEMQQQAIRKNDENFARLYQQQQDMFNTYRRNEAVDGVIDSLILLGVLFG